MSNTRLQQTQHQVDEVMGIMRENVDKVLDRDQKLNDLDDRAENLQVGAAQFERTAHRVRRKMWCKNVKTMIMLGVVVAVVLLVLGIIIWQATK